MFYKDIDGITSPNGDAFMDDETKASWFNANKVQMPYDADGMYILVKGCAKIINRVDNYDYEGFELRKGEGFGASKFLFAQGYSYFGDIVAKKPKQEELEVEKTPKEAKFKQMNSVVIKKPGGTTPQSKKPKGPGQDQTEVQQSQHIIQCLVIPMQCFYLIPFYDAYSMRECLATKKEY